MKENSIEEDIARIAKLITTKFNNDYSIDNTDKEAIEHILSNYKRVLKENERYQKSDYETICLENNELKEKNERLESENQEFLYKYGNILKENEELKDKYATFVKMSSEVIANCIPIQKVKDKIEEYKARKAKCNDIESEIRLDVKIKAYEELLEK